MDRLQSRLQSNWTQLATTFSKRPFTKENGLYFYTPLVSSVSYNILALNVLTPRIVERLDLLRLTNLHIINSIAGLSLYVYSRRLLSKQKLSHRASQRYLVPQCLYTDNFYLGSIHVAGSILFWAVCSRMLPESCKVFRLGLALSSATGMLTLNYRLLQFIDNKLKPTDG